MTSAHRESIETKNREAVERIEEGLRRAVGDEEAAGALGQALEAHSDELSEQIAATFGGDREDAVQAQIKRMLDERDEEFMRRLSADDERNPLGPIMATLRTWARERKDDQDTRDEKLEAKVDELLSRAAELAGLDQGREALEEAEQVGTERAGQLRGAGRPVARVNRRHPGRRLIAHWRRGRRGREGRRATR